MSPSLEEREAELYLRRQAELIGALRRLADDLGHARHERRGHHHDLIDELKRLADHQDQQLQYMDTKLAILVTAAAVGFSTLATMAGFSPDSSSREECQEFLTEKALPAFDDMLDRLNECLERQREWRASFDD